MDVWWEVVSIAESIEFTDEPDTPVWSFNSNDIYSVQSLYAVVNFCGVKPVYPSAIWVYISLHGSRFSFGFSAIINS
jgi:hypothetical protein